MKNWTSQQQMAITDRGRSVIVSAAAGSGKTAVLVERLLQILSDTQHPVRADTIVVVTFTNDAAAQMKQRLSLALEEAMESESDDAVYDWLFQQNLLLQHARISTINAFCFDLIRENADACGVSSSFRVVEPTEETIYQEAAMQEVLSLWSKERQEDMETLCSALCSLDDSELVDRIQSIARYLDSLAFPGQWMQKARTLCGSTNALFEGIRQNLCKELERILQIVDLCRPYAEHAHKKLYDICQEDAANIRQHMKFLQSVSMEHLLECPLVHHAEFSKFSNVRKDVSMEDKLIFQQFRDIYIKWYNDAISSALSNLHFLTSDAVTEQTIIPLLLELTQAFLDALLRHKKERNVLGFSDGERLALDLLGTVREDGTIVRTPLGEQLSSHYRLIMIDEYQDSNNKQDCLFKLLSHGGMFQPSVQRLQYGTNAFLVGDVKQSIYRFRQANPQNFMNALEDSTPIAECREGEVARLYLNRNFRSSEGVIDFVNGLFGCIMTQNCGEVSYDQNEYLNFGASAYKGMEHTRTQLIFPFVPETDDAGEGTEEEEAMDLQAECVADLIADRIRRKVPVLDGSRLRPCEPKDFCILLRSSKKWIKHFQKALQKYGVAAAKDNGESFLCNPEIRLISNFLQVLDNPLTDMALAAVMLSPIYGFTAEELVILQNASHVSRLYRQLHSYLKINAAECTDLYRKCRLLTEQIDGLRKQADAMPLEALIRAVYEETDMLSLQSLYDDAETRRSNLEYYPQLARTYREHAEQTDQNSIGGWLRYLDSVRKGGSDMEIGHHGDAECSGVAIKTIHGSKGLEYPFVILAHPETRFNTEDKKVSFCADEEGHIGLSVLNKKEYLKFRTVTHSYITNKRMALQKSEELRLLYVALTRAKQQLLIVMDTEKALRYCRGKGKAEDYRMHRLLQAEPSAVSMLAEKAGCMEEWILQFLLSTSDADALLDAMNGISSETTLAEYIVWNKRLCILEKVSEKQEIHAAADPGILVAMKKQLQFSYRPDRKPLVAKHSVTSLAHPEQTFTDLLQEPEFMKEEQQKKGKFLQGASRGTAVHKMMQYMDFARAAADPETECKRLMEEGYLNSMEAETLSPYALRQFFHSSLYQRIAASPCVYKEKQLFVKIGELDVPEQSLLREYAGTDGILIGTIDLLFREGDSWVIVDYKTDRGKSEQELVSHYQLQLWLYQKAAEKILNGTVAQAYIYSFTLHKVLEVQFSEVSY